MRPDLALAERVNAPPARSDQPLRVTDVAVWYGARSGGIRTYLDAKAAVAAQTGAFEHHLIVPAAREHHDGRRRHELPGVSVGRANGYRLPLDAGPLLRTLQAIRPDVVLLHDAQWFPTAVVRFAHGLGAAVVAVHHGTAHAAAIGRPGPQRAWRRGLSALQRRLYQRADAVMAYGCPPPEAAGIAHIPLRYGVDAAFRPRPPARRGEHVLYAGRMSPEKGIELLFDAIAAGPSDQRLHLVGRGPAERALRRRASRLRIEHRVDFRPFLRDPAALARAYAQAGCVVVPGRHETFGLVVLEAAASGAAVVASSEVPSAGLADGLVQRFPGDDTHALARTIDRAITSQPDLVAAARLSRRLSWRHAVEAELADLGALRR